jgi:integrase
VISHEERIEQILASSELPAAIRLLKKDQPELEDREIEQLEDLVLVSESGTARLDRLIETLHKKMAETYNGLRGKLVTRVAFRPPQYQNVLAGGFAEPEKVCDRAEEWLECMHSEGSRDPARLLGELVVSLIIEFQILDEDAIPALVRSLSQGRRIVLDQWSGATPIEIVNAKKADRIERLLIPKGEALNTMRALMEDRNAREYLQQLAAKCADDQRAGVRAIEAIEGISGEKKLRVTIKPLIKAACQMAILKMRTSVIAVRTGVVRSHALNLATMQRITGSSPRIKSFTRPKQEEDGKEPAPDVEIDEEEFTAWPWMQELRKLVKADGYDKPGLQELKRTGDFCGRTLAGYALLLIGRKRFGASTVHKYVFLIASRLMLKVAGEDEVRAKEAWENLLADQIAWEDLIEEVLDDDAYYHRRRYSGSAGATAATPPKLRAGNGKREKNPTNAECREEASEASNGSGGDGSANRGEPSEADPDRDEAGYSRALLRALGAFVEYLNRGKQASEELTTKLPPAGMIRVDATMITVDEFRRALDWFDSRHFQQSQVHLRKAARVALILAMRCGLRRAELAYTRVSDIDRPMPNEDLETADIRLRVRPWLLRKLKTANALRDLPLSVLMPVEELREVLDWVDAVRGNGGPDALVFHRKNAKNKSDYAKTMGFDAVVDALTDAFTKDVKKRKGKGRPPIVPAWHMHQCRHAFANITLLRLWPELQEFARQALRYHPLTLAWIAGREGNPEQFRLDLFKAGIRGSDLQAIALLMGHGASATTAEHYLHVIDWSGPFEVGQLNISRPQNNQTSASSLAALFHQSPAPAAEGPPAS